MEKKEIAHEVKDVDAKVYEVGFHIIPTVAEDELGAHVTAIRDVIEGAGGKMISDEYPKHVDLAYPMMKLASNKRAHYHSAYFGWMKFDGMPEAAAKILAGLKKDESILRVLLVKTVRENTMAPKKIFREKRTEEGQPAKSEEKVEVKPVLTEEELDKTIEDLVIS